MKKLLVILAVAAVGFAVYRKFFAAGEERSLWAEVTDPVA
jgi:hypothetical protein